ncbi:disco-interacting protein 2 isoform X9, partial [Vespula maculifrons]
MAEFNIDIGKLPEDVREKLAELDLELSEEAHLRCFPQARSDEVHDLKGRRGRVSIKFRRDDGDDDDDDDDDDVDDDDDDDVDVDISTMGGLMSTAENFQ